MLENKELVLATNNQHKIEEISRLFSGFKITTPSNLGIEFEYEEKGESFLDNALAKAMSLFQSIRKPVLADDSGLVVFALNGEPGIYSSRYGSKEKGRKLSDRERIDFLLARMAGHDDRRCFFVCCIALVVEENRFFISHETVNGLLSRYPAGTGGFGYDPVFYIPELKKTAAQLSDKEKDRISHRGRASRCIMSLISKI